MSEPVYTPEEANEMLPGLRQSLVRIREARQVVEGKWLVREDCRQ